MLMMRVQTFAEGTSFSEGKSQYHFCQEQKIFNALMYFKE